jgi:galactokinase
MTLDSQLSVSEQALLNFERLLRPGAAPYTLHVPGRVNLIGEHIDYYGLPVMPVAIQKQIAIAFLPRKDGYICAKSAQYADSIQFPLASPFVPRSPGHWSNYVRAVASAMQGARVLKTGIDAYVASNLPLAAGLSSSSALLIAFGLALLAVNCLTLTLNELTSVLPDGEQLVGTRGGAMDHIAILASRAGFATLIRSFAPLAIEHVPVPPHWRFLIAHSLVTAEKSGAVRSEYNARRDAGFRALAKLGFASYADLIGQPETPLRLSDLSEDERNVFLHATSEARRVLDAAAALWNDALPSFGRLMCESHASLRDRLNVSVPKVDALVEAALHAGAVGARLTGAGFGGCVVCLCSAESVESVRERLIATFYRGQAGFDPIRHLFVAEPCSGALQAC